MAKHLSQSPGFVEIAAVSKECGENGKTENCKAKNEEKKEHLWKS